LRQQLEHLQFALRQHLGVAHCGSVVLHTEARSRRERKLKRTLFGTASQVG
jgi:hypothetical protein